MEKQMQDKYLNYEDELLEQVEEEYHKPCVYIMHNHLSGLTKIGYTNNLNRRYKQITNNIGTKPEIIYTDITSEAYQLEQLLHEKFKDYREEGEWFNLNEDIIEEMRDTK